MQRRQPRSLRSLAVCLGLLAGCGPLIDLSDDSASDVGDGTMTSGRDPATTTTTTGRPPSTTTTSAGTTVPRPPPPPPPSDSSGVYDGVSFIDEGGFDSGPMVFECSILAQDCPEDEKCMPWANDGGFEWNATRCSPIDENPGVPGDACTVEGSGWSGIDSCELGAMCWTVDPDTLTGTCVATCTGSERNPSCIDVDATCIVDDDAVLALCIPHCDPLTMECSVGQVCAPVGESFLCTTDVSADMGAAGDPCASFNACDPGHMCGPPNFVPGCATSGCCTALCDLTDPMPACLPDQQCLPYFMPGTAPEQYIDLGVCIGP